MVYEFRQDDPKKCTSAKLRKFHLVQRLANVKRIPSSSIVLNPASHQTLSKADRTLVQLHGLVALDCSWNLSQEIFERRIPGENRRLPTLLAGNPTNYGVHAKLSTAEALAAGLFITGFDLQAKRVLSLFKWGNTFLSLNKEPLDAYARSPSQEVAEREKEFFGTGPG